MLPLEHGSHCLNIDLQFGEIVQFWSKPSHYLWFSHSSCCASDLRSCSGNKIWRFIPKPGVVQFWTHPGKNTVTECLCVGVVFTFLSPLLLLWFLFVSIFYCWGSSKVPQGSTQAPCSELLGMCSHRNQAAQSWSHLTWSSLSLVNVLLEWWDTAKYSITGSRLGLVGHACISTCTAKYWCLGVSYSPQAPFVLSRQTRDFSISLSRSDELPIGVLSFLALTKEPGPNG